MAPLVITKFITKHQLARWWDRAHHSQATIQFYQKIVPQCFLLFLFLADHQFLGKHIEPIHSDHFWLQLLWPLAIYFSKRALFLIAQCHQ